MVWQKVQGGPVAVLTSMHENWCQKIADTSSCKANVISQSFPSCVVSLRGSSCTLSPWSCIEKAERHGGYQPFSIGEGRSTTHNVSLLNFISWRTSSHLSLDRLIYHSCRPINLYFYPIYVSPSNLPWHILYFLWHQKEALFPPAPKRKPESEDSHFFPSCGETEASRLRTPLTRNGEGSAHLHPLVLFAQIKEFAIDISEVVTPGTE